MLEIYGYVDGRSEGTRTYRQQQRSRVKKRERYYTRGSTYTAYGPAGLAADSR
ncbi:hypothetical protein [Streptomyces blattellae]|uniref:hypothetical protein n=1 Tax=Streptomyces blattellae TaxID=2569855 RepID=UPI0012B9C7CB|nr:hypothetical protein [Streptomyces blattellae]